MSSYAHYAAFAQLRQAGWFRNFDTSPGDNLIVAVAGAPAIGSHPGGVLFAGSWTKPDGTTLFQRSNMDRSVTTVVIDPQGAITHNFWNATLVESSDEIIKRNII
jgi:hypothetical protein